ncbi:hypothetical protein EV182_002750 [Spiromyces aspiralis]|uniref:Uncharacterized protein n=1 Tax=Spiromyces aspiralis TaxID=68401 RepID=A0ACC1HHK9_9FUNG|nr:hypothetical protein EV182_002750 [Spiromyces aspiralis]
MVFRLHGKMSQYQRSTVTRRFREYKTSRGQTAILVTSDVSARGVDYPNVSTVVQVGIPSDPAHYIHRVGRTGRAGKQGYAISLLSSAEIEFLKHLPGVPIKESADLTPDNLGLIEESEDYQNKWKEARKSINPELLNEAFVALLGFYVGRDSYINATGQDLLKMVSGLTKPFDLPTPHIPATLRSMLRLDQGANSSRYRRPTQPFFKSHNNRGSSNNSWSRNDRGKRYSRRDGGNRPKQGY